MFATLGRRTGMFVRAAIMNAPATMVQHKVQPVSLQQFSISSSFLLTPSRSLFTIGPLQVQSAARRISTLQQSSSQSSTSSLFATIFVPSRGIKTKKAAAKRFIKTGSGHLKYGHAGKRHLTSHKKKDRKRRLNCKGLLEGVWAKKMMKLVVKA